MAKGKRVNTAAEISQIIEINGVLYAYDQVSNIGSDHHGDLYAFDAQTGEQQWHYLDTNGKNPNHPEYNKHGSMIYNLTYWNGGLFSRSRQFSLDGPTQSRFGLSMGGNLRCVRNTSSANYLIHGFGGYIDRFGNAYQTHLVVATAPCPTLRRMALSSASSMKHAAATMAFALCQGALIPAVPLEPIADSERLNTAPFSAAVADTSSKLPDSPLLVDMDIVEGLRLAWHQDYVSGSLTDEYSADLDVQRHLLTVKKEAKSPGNTAPMGACIPCQRLVTAWSTCIQRKAP